MCLPIDQKLTKNIKRGEQEVFQVFKFMLQDSEGNLWSPKQGGIMQLDENGYYHSDRKDPKIIPWEGEKRKLDNGIHTWINKESAYNVLRLVARHDRIAANSKWERLRVPFTIILCKAWKRPVDSKFVVVEFEGKKEDFIAAGFEKEKYPIFPGKQMVFTKVKFIKVCEPLST